MIGAVADPALTGLALLCAGRLVWVDMRRFEIETPTLALLAVALLAQALLRDPLGELLIRALAAVGFYGAVILLTRTVRGLGRIGAGDPPLIGVIAFMVFPLLLPWSLLAGALILLTAALYARARGKRFGKSLFPAAPPLIGGGAPIYLLQLAWA